MKYFFRLIAFPFVAIIILIASLRNYFYTCWLWLSRGGELLTYDEVFNPESIRDQFKKLNESRFCECSKEIKTGSGTAWHCNICGKLEQSETWLK